MQKENKKTLQLSIDIGEEYLLFSSEKENLFLRRCRSKCGSLYAGDFCWHSTNQGSSCVIRSEERKLALPDLNNEPAEESAGSPINQ